MISWGQLTSTGLSNWDCRVFYGKSGNTVHLQGWVRCDALNGSEGICGGTLPSVYYPRGADYQFEVDERPTLTQNKTRTLEAYITGTGTIGVKGRVPYHSYVSVDAQFICASTST